MSAGGANRPFPACRLVLFLSASWPSLTVLLPASCPLFPPPLFVPLTSGFPPLATDCRSRGQRRGEAGQPGGLQGQVRHPVLVPQGRTTAQGPRPKAAGGGGKFAASQTPVLPGASQRRNCRSALHPPRTSPLCAPPKSSPSLTVPRSLRRSTARWAGAGEAHRGLEPTAAVGQARCPTKRRGTPAPERV